MQKLRRKVPGAPPGIDMQERPMVDAPSSFRTNFLAEVVMLSAMRHPNVVACYGSLVDDDQTFLLECVSLPSTRLYTPRANAPYAPYVMLCVRTPTHAHAFASLAQVLRRRYAPRQAPQATGEI